MRLGVRSWLREGRWGVSGTSAPFLPSCAGPTGGASPFLSPPRRSPPIIFPADASPSLSQGGSVAPLYPPPSVVSPLVSTPSASCRSTASSGLRCTNHCANVDAPAPSPGRTNGGSASFLLPARGAPGGLILRGAPAVVGRAQGAAATCAVTGGAHGVPCIVTACHYKVVLPIRIVTH